MEARREENAGLCPFSGSRRGRWRQGGGRGSEALEGVRTQRQAEGLSEA